MTSTPDLSTPRPPRAEHTRADGARAVWEPIRRRPEVSARASRDRQRRRGLIQGGVGLGAAAAFAFFDRPVMAAVAGALSLVLILAATLRPAGLQRCLQASAERVGIILAVVLLTPVYVFFFVPFGLLFRSGHRDRLERRFEPRATSYWRERKPKEPGAAPFERQF